MILFRFSEYRPIYTGFTVLVLLMLALDLGVFHRKAHAISFREASAWSVVWVVLALVFNYALRVRALEVFGGCAAAGDPQL